MCDSSISGNAKFNKKREFIATNLWQEFKFQENWNQLKTILFNQTIFLIMFHRKKRVKWGS